MDVDVSTDIDDAESWKNKGNDFYKDKDYRKAVEAYTKSITVNPSNALYLTNRAAAYLMLLQYKEAVDDCIAAIKLDSNNSKAFFRKATGLKGLGRLDAAIESLTAGLEIDPNSTQARKDLQLLSASKTKLLELQQLVLQKQYRSALPLIDGLIRDIGTNFRDLNLLKVEALIELKRPQDAYNLSNYMMKSAPNGDADLLRLRARCFYDMGDIENASKHLGIALRQDPDNSNIRTFYRRIRDIEEKKSTGDSAFKNGNYEDAIENYSACIELTKDNRPYSSKLYLNRAISLAKVKKHDLCVKDCTVAIAFNSEYIKAYQRRGDSYIAMGGPQNIEQAISDYERATELESDEATLKSIQQKIKKAKVSLKRSKRKDLYAVLGVSQEATESEIKTAYRKAALKYHPDKQATKSDEEKAEAEAMFKSIGEAYEVLSNPEKKAKYDEGVELEDIDNPSHDGHSHGGVDPNMLFHMFMQQHAGRR
eukprot:gene4609-6486_t